MSVIGFVNFFDLLPTLLALTLSPGHFYKRLPQYIRNKNSWFKTPIKFFTSAVALIVAQLFFFENDLLSRSGFGDQKLVAKYVALICITAPLTLPIICLILRIFLTFTPTNFAPALPKSLRINFLIPLSMFTYTRLNYTRFLWSVFYFGIYFYLALQVLQLIGIYEIRTVNFLGSIGENRCASEYDALDPIHIVPKEQRDRYMEACLREDEVSGRTNARNMFFGLLIVPAGFVIFAVLGYVIIINPYLWLLKISLKIPTKRMHKSDAWSVNEPLLKLIEGGRRKDVKIADADFVLLRLAISRLEVKIKKDDHDASAQKGEFLAMLRMERQQIYTKTLRLDNLRKLAFDDATPARIRTRLISAADLVDRLLLSSKA